MTIHNDISVGDSPDQLDDGPETADSPSAHSDAPMVAEEAVLGALGVSTVSTEIKHAVATLLAAFNDKILYDAGKDRQIERLHAELQDCRGDAIGKLVRPVFLRVIRLHSDLSRIIETVRQSDELLPPEKAARALGSFREDIEDLLADYGVSAFREADETFSPRRQTAVATVATDDPDLKGRIAERLRPGFEQGNLLLEKERVTVFKYEPQLEVMGD